MCDLTAGSTTIVGPPGQLAELQERWSRLDTVRRLELLNPSLITLSDLGPHWRGAPGILAVSHDESLGHLVADELTIELVYGSYMDVVCEPDYSVGLAGGPDIHENPNLKGVEWNPVALDTLAKFVAATSSNSNALDKRVAVLDSGISGGNMLDLLGDFPQHIPGVDEVGHGTAIAALIEKLCPDVMIHPVRVIARQRGESRHLLLGLIATLWPDEDGNARYDIVNVSLSVQLVDTCASSLGMTMAYIRNKCAKQGTVPALVAAAGNSTSNQQFGYPAALPYAIAVIGLDWDGNPAPYNVTVPGGFDFVEAFGGVPAEPIGWTTSRGGRAPLFGSSFAAAVATSRLLRTTL